MDYSRNSRLEGKNYKYE